MPAITWDEKKTPLGPRRPPVDGKLHKRVRFQHAAPLPDNPPSLAETLHPSAVDPPPPSQPRRRPSIFKRLRRLHVANPDPDPAAEAEGDGTPPELIADAAPPSPADSDASAQSWTHHASYFPEYTPIYTTTTLTDPYPLYTNLHPARALAQQQADTHATAVGHSVVVHYPVLPAFADYGVRKEAGGAGWRTGKWGTEGWTGYGWEGETLPDEEGRTFGIPMPEGVAIVAEENKEGGGGKKKKKKKKGKGGGCGGGGGGGDGDDKGDGEDGEGGGESGDEE
ncbi:hypothetical protein Q5752_002998 [Cryptotrichosporon argae]